MAVAQRLKHASGTQPLLNNAVSVVECTFIVATCNGVSPRLFLFLPGEQEIELCGLQKFCSRSFLLFLPSVSDQ